VLPEEWLEEGAPGCYLPISKKGSRPILRPSPRAGGGLSADWGHALHHPHIGDSRGLEIVADCTTKAPFDPARGVHKQIKAAAFEAGLIC